MMKCKEHLLHFFLQGKLSLSQYDYKFMANLQMMIHNSHRVTSNQSDLFDKLISKYAKQLAKADLVKEELKDLPWKTMVVQSTSEYTGANVSLLNDIITVKVPFSKNFISGFREIDDNPFVWIKEDKVYRAPFSTIALKILYNFLPNHFKTNYCEVLHDIIQDLKKHEGLIWEPTLVRVNDSVILAAANPVVADLLNGIDLSLTPNRMYAISRYQIPAHPNLFDGDKKLKFAYEFVTEVDIDDIIQVAEWMRALHVDSVLVGKGLSQNVQLYTEIENASIAQGIRVTTGYRSFNHMTGHAPKGKANSVFLLLPHTNVNTVIPLDSDIDKVVILKNSRPVEVR